jgi:hypothetical protein
MESLSRSVAECGSVNESKSTQMPKGMDTCRTDEGAHYHLCQNWRKVPLVLKAFPKL